MRELHLLLFLLQMLMEMVVGKGGLVQQGLSLAVELHPPA